MRLKSGILILFTVLIHLPLWADIVYVTDFEGRIHPLQNLLAKQILRVDQDGLLELKDPGTEIVFGGDMMDRGPYSLRLLRDFTKLKKRYPKRVHLIWGNHDLNKLSFLFQEIRDGAKFPHLEQLQSWAKRMGIERALEFHRQELAEILNRPVTPEEANQDYLDLITNPKRELYAYLEVGQLALTKPTTLFLHGSLPSHNGFVPGSSKSYGSVDAWAKDLNAWGHAMLLAHKSLAEHRDSSAVNLESLANFLYYSDALFDGSSGRVQNHDNSVVYGPRYRVDQSLRLPPERNLDWLAASGKSLLVLGHTPAGEIPVPLRDRRVVVLMADTSYSSEGDTHLIRISGKKLTIVGDAKVSGPYRTQIQAATFSAVGMIAGDETVVTVAKDGRLILAKSDGRSVRYRAVPPTTEFLSQLQFPQVSRVDEVEDRREQLVHAIAQSGARLIDAEEALTFQGRSLIPILVVGSSKYAASQIDLIAKSFVDRLLSHLDKEKVVLLTGGTDDGVFEATLHQEAHRRGFKAHGLLVSKARGESLNKSLRSFSLVGHTWDQQPLAGLELVVKTNGLALIFGGGPLVQSALNSFHNPANAMVLYAANVRHGNGPDSASMEFGARYPQFAFSDPEQLIETIRSHHPEVLVEAGPALKDCEDFLKNLIPN